MEATVNTTAVSNENNANRSALYHYTAGWEKIAAILATEVISKEFKMYEEQVTAAWLSSNPVWENTVMKVKGGLEAHADKLGAFRIKVKNHLPVLHWHNFVKFSGENEKICRGMETVGLEQGANPDEWYCSLYHIPVSDNTVESIGIYRNGKWEDMSIKEFKENFADKLRKVKINIITHEQVIKLMNKGVFLSPVLEDILKNMVEKNENEVFSFALIDNMIHCISAHK